MKIKVFGWLLLFDRLNTKDILVRRHWRSATENNCCVLCLAQIYEDRLHMFFTYNFSTRMWNYLLIEWLVDGNLYDCLQHASYSFGHPFVMEVMLIAAWGIWLV